MLAMMLNDLMETGARLRQKAGGSRLSFQTGERMARDVRSFLPPQMNPFRPALWSGLAVP